jgi:membrane-bound lytic murein transglycosylase F
VAAASPAPAQRGPDRYDQTFRKYSKRFFGVGFDWRAFKAQGMTESRLDPTAQSGVGARGIMQLMPSTFREIQSRNPEWSSVDDVEWNIAAGIYYDRQLWRLWRDDVHDGDHHRFMFASYNAGRVPILTAQRMAREEQLDPRAWTSVEAIAPKVPRWRHRETVTYVARIWENLGRLDARGRVAAGRPPPAGEREPQAGSSPR